MERYHSRDGQIHEIYVYEGGRAKGGRDRGRKGLIEAEIDSRMRRLANLREEKHKEEKTACWSPQLGI